LAGKSPANGIFTGEIVCECWIVQQVMFDYNVDTLQYDPKINHESNQKEKDLTSDTGDVMRIDGYNSRGV
jgi:hypothetical protein